METAPPIDAHPSLGDFNAPVLTNGKLNRHAAAALPNLELLDQEQIVFIIPASGDVNGYFVYNLSEGGADGDESYRLSVSLVSHVPEDLLERHALTSIPPYLRSDSHHQVHVIVSTKSGTGLALKCWESVVEPLLCIAEQGTKASRDTSATSDAAEDDVNLRIDSFGYNVLVTDSARSVREFARDRWRATDGQINDKTQKSETIILLSGDGGIVDLLNGADLGRASNASSPTIAILPLGTGNALFHSLHKSVYREKGPSPLVASLRTLFRGKAAPLPIFRASFSPGSHVVTYTDPSKGAESAAEDLERHEDSVEHLLGAIVASYGFHASIVWESDTPEYRRHGDKRFGMVAQELLRESHAYKCDVDLVRSNPDGAPAGSTTGEKDGQTEGEVPAQWERVPRPESGYVLATLVSNLERNFTISPASQPLGRQLRLVHFGAVDGERTMGIMRAAYDNGAHVGMKWTDEEGGEQGVGYDEIDALRVTVAEEDARWRKVCIDGTIVEVPRGGSMTVETVRESPFQILADASIGAAP